MDDGWTYLNLEECKKACEDVSNCNSIAWNSRDNGCFLKHKKDACDDKSCAWGRNDARDWNFYWKTKDSLYWKDVYIGRKKTCGNFLLRVLFQKNNLKNPPLFILRYTCSIFLENTTTSMEQSIPITGEQEHSAQTDTLELRKGIEISLCNT